jgi:hypothetical protein
VIRLEIRVKGDASFPFFFDPDFTAEIPPLPRWDVVSRPNGGHHYASHGARDKIRTCVLLVLL